MTANENIVKLDIGGTVFKTSKSTLTKYDGFFKAMMETEIPVTKDESGAIFIDRSPKHFDLILNFMRDGDVALPKSEQELEEILKEAQYYLLEGLMEKCKNRIPEEISKIIERLNELGSQEKEKSTEYHLIIHYRIEDWSVVFSKMSAEQFLRNIKILSKSRSKKSKGASTSRIIGHTVFVFAKRHRRLVELTLKTIWSV